MARVTIYRNRAIQFSKRQTKPLVDRVSARILEGARTMAPRGDHLSGSGRPKLGQPLQNSLHIRNEPEPLAVVNLVGSSVNWAATVHQGSEPHDIVSRNGKLLTFRWERGTLLLRARQRGRRGRLRSNSRGGLVYFRFERVRHPGNKRPVRYLTTPMHLFGRAANFRTTSTPVNRTRLP